mmetsp:Transcript_19565/g.48967  ORF Transcript_19565/g.48967 Transcript_19565/m.48967 type:complete len:231 (-) Transcript_19565:961-1653(-)
MSPVPGAPVGGGWTTRMAVGLTPLLSSWRTPPSASSVSPYTMTPVSSPASSGVRLAARSAKRSTGSSSAAPRRTRVWSWCPAASTSISYGSAVSSLRYTQRCSRSSPTTCASTTATPPAAPPPDSSASLARLARLYTEAGPPTENPPGATTVMLLKAHPGTVSRRSTTASAASVAPTMTTRAFTATRGAAEMRAVKANSAKCASYPVWLRRPATSWKSDVTTSGGGGGGS